MNLIISHFTFKKAITVFTTILFFGIASTAQQSTQTFQWPQGKKAAISLTFDDARLSQVDHGIPVLDKYGVKATFYLNPGAMRERKEGWQKAVKSGHEIGNHSNTHPCTGNFDWSRDNALENHTLQSIGLDIDSCSLAIKNDLGVQPVSFAFPCGQKFIGRGANAASYVPLISEKFESGRGWLDEGANDPAFCDMAQLTGVELDGKTFEQVKQLIETAKSKGQWLILAGHEMNNGGTQTSLLATIEAICKYAADPANGVWVGTVHEVASYINQNREPFK
ncbi:MAG: polysaccharide deacetylase family protein [Chitinophagaceae bacterium]|nr:polysaccharide deacetylase family protein [Chitinophagaceae bacterium]